MGGTGGGTLATPEAAADAFLMVAVTSWDDLRPPIAAAEVEEEEAKDGDAAGPPRGDRMGKPLSLANEGSSFCRGSNLILGMEILKNVSNLTLLIFNGVI